MRQARIQRVSRAVGSIHVLVSRTSGVEEVEVERRRLHSPRCIPSRRRSVGRFGAVSVSVGSWDVTENSRRWR